MMESDERKCPECAETIKKDAAVCKHCGHRFRSPNPSDGPRTEGEKKVAKYSRIGCAGVVVAVIGLFALVDFPDPPSREEILEIQRGSGPGKAEEQDGPLSREAQRNLVIMSRDGIRKRLKDPDSAQFRDVGYYSGGRAAAVCGYVNAKNAFGGFSGYERFVALGDAAFFESDVNDGKFGVEVWDQICVKADTDEPNIP
ncbi:zinc ribbon domain-containing protein [Blastomonas marina]|uniref:zinc ribbon domain-containing protein n=1 Tax=Blastomonas marina TaxID=1867408 RepID=UPI002AC9D28C|nr:zinc ribbon domain-containing protein [Blastomonas marina]WPZ03081.1 zinc ribbon domain-containing protein [Blastomonas marina]